MAPPESAPRNGPKAPVAVVGAGPAGLAAAITVARAGRRVRVLERHGSVGHRFHGDMQGLENWSADHDALEGLRSLGIGLDFAHRGFDEVTFLWLPPSPGYCPHQAATVLSRSSWTGRRHAGYRVAAPGPGLWCRGPIRRSSTPGRTWNDRGHRPATRRWESPQATSSTLRWRTKLTPSCIRPRHPVVTPIYRSGTARRHWPPVLFRDAQLWRPALDATMETFMDLVPGLRLDAPRRFGGYGGLLTPTRFADESGRLDAGEAAGLQDAEWGFGMMTAMRSGVLAANSLLDAQEYAAVASREFNGARAAGLVNRAMWDKLPQWLLDRALRFETERGDLSGRLRRHWAPNPVKSLLAPRLLAGYADRLRDIDSACHDESCRCLRCSCGELVRPERG